MVERELLDVAQRMLDEAREDVKHADQKASVLFAALGIGFGAVLGGQLSAGWDSSTLSTCGRVFWWTGAVLAILSVAASALAVWPRYTLDDRPTYGITYWGHVAAFDDPKQVQTALETQQTTSMSRASHQLWSLSRIVLKKYRCVRLALLSAGASGLLLGLATIIIH